MRALYGYDATTGVLPCCVWFMDMALSILYFGAWLECGLYTLFAHSPIVKGE